MVQNRGDVKKLGPRGKKRWQKIPPAKNSEGNGREGELTRWEENSSSRKIQQNGKSGEKGIGMEGRKGKKIPSRNHNNMSASRNLGKRKPFPLP